jgi:hypothetical protein
MSDSTPAVCMFSIAEGEYLAQVPIWADQAIASGQCAHVNSGELLPHDGLIYAVYDSPCYDRDTRSYRCQKQGTGKLYLVACRFRSAGKSSLRVGFKVEVAPASALGIEGGHEKQGTCIVDWQTFVLHPTYRKLPKYWTMQFRITVSGSEEAVDASIDVVTRTRREGSQSITSGISIPTTVPASLDGGSQMTLEIGTIVLAESIKLLLKDGWDFIKDHTEHGSELTQLNIGSLAISADAQSPENITTIIEGAHANLSSNDVQELDGLNKRLSIVYRKKKHLTAGVERAATTKDRADAEAEIEQLEVDITEIREKIWRVLTKSGAVSLVQRAM